MPYSWPHGTPSPPCCAGQPGVDDTNTELAKATTDDANTKVTIYGCSTDMGSILSRGQSEAAGRNRRCGPPLRCGQVSSPVGVERVDADALSSLTCAGWLPQDRGFEVGVWPLV